MRNMYKFIWLPILFLPFCGSRKPELAPTINAKGISFSVEADWRRVACENALLELKAQQPPTYAPQAEKPVRAKIEPVSASEAIHY